MAESNGEIAVCDVFNFKGIIQTQGLVQVTCMKLLEQVTLTLRLLIDLLRIENTYDEFVWVEKYRPRRLKSVFSLTILKTFLDFLDKGEVPNLLLSGPPGCGKTTVAKALCEQLGSDYYVINGSDEGRF